MVATEKIRARQRTAYLFKKCISRYLKIPEKLSVSEWAERYRVLDESSNFAGRWNNDITPYLVGIMNAFCDAYIQEINFVKPTQVGGTETLFNILGWIIMENPSPTMIIYDTDDLAKDTSRDRIQPSLLKTKEIEERFYKNESKELNLKFKGMHVYLRGGGSPGKLASKAIKYLFFDEIDKLPGASKKEANPYRLAKERTKTFPYTKKIYTCSTPTLKTNYVWQIHENADEQRQYFVPCSYCKSMITFKFSQIHFNENKELTNAERAGTAVYVCQECGCEITDKDKVKMLRAGEWRDTKKTHAGKARKVSFWLNALYSRFLTWKDIVLEFLDSKDDPEQLQNFVNSWLAEPWEDTKLKTSSDLVMDRQTNLGQYVLPSWTKLLTGGVDVQENCIYWTIRAFGNFITSQNVAHGQAYSLNELEAIMNMEFVTETGEKKFVNLCFIDSGYNTDAVYDFCADNSDWALPSKGASNPMQSHFKISKVNNEASKAQGMRLVIVDGGKYKDMIAARMQRKNGRGSWMVYSGCDLEYAKQVTSEHKVVVKNGNKKNMQWVQKTSHADNHYLDAEVYALAAADTLGVRMLHLQSEEDDAEPQEQMMEKQQQENNWINTSGNWLDS